MRRIALLLVAALAAVSVRGGTNSTNSTEATNSTNSTSALDDFDVDGLTEALMATLGPTAGNTEQQFTSFLTDASLQQGSPQMLGALSSEFGSEVAGILSGLDSDPMGHTMKQMSQLGGFGAGSLLPGHTGAQAMGSIPQGVPIRAFMDMIRGEVCTPAHVDMGRKELAHLYGPVLNISLSMGNCSVVHDKKKDETIECTGPRLAYRKTPITYVSKHHTPVVFTSEECLVSKEFGHWEEKILYSAGEDVVFESLEDFAKQLATGALGNLLGFGPTQPVQRGAAQPQAQEGMPGMQVMAGGTPLFMAQQG